MKTGALVLIGIGAFIVYRVFRSGLGTISSSSSSDSSQSGTSGGTSSTNGQGSSTPDIGTHEAIDSTGDVTGTAGSVYTINQPYATMSDQQKDDANAFAHANTA
jgi:hypothetical protein